jgi:GNAT superfamily N-acetyltransferase
VIRDGGVPVAYLFGFFSQTEPAGYVHVIAVHPAHRNGSLATQLYEHFSKVAAAHGCCSLKAITHPSNWGSIRFHRRIGMQLMGVPNEDGIPVVRDYSGPGEDRVVFRKELSPGGGAGQAARATERKR